MKKLETKPKEEKTPDTNPVPEPPKPEPTKPVEKVKEKPDYTWVWVLIGLLATIGAVYFMNISKPKDDGNNQLK